MWPPCDFPEKHSKRGLVVVWITPSQAIRPRGLPEEEMGLVRRNDAQGTEA